MLHPFLSDLARRISLHPGCRVELRHHWPAPHYHKTPQDTAAEAEETIRRHAARTSTPAPAAPGGVTTSDTDAASPPQEPFNPFQHFRVRKRGTRRKHKQQQEQQQCSLGSPPPPSVADNSAAAAPSGMMPRRLRGIDVDAASGTKRTSAVTREAPASPGKTSKRAKACSGETGATSATAMRSGLTLTSSSSPLASSATPVSQHSVKRGGATTAATAAAASSSAKRGLKAHAEPRVAESSAGGALKKARPPRRESAARGGSIDHSSSNRSSSSSNSSSADTRCDSDLDSADFEPFHDPLHIRLPRNPVHPTTNGAPHAIRVSVRWSGAAQRRRHELRQRRRQQRGLGHVEQDSAPRREVTMTPPAFEMANTDTTSPTPCDPRAQQQRSRSDYRIPVVGGAATAEEEEEDEHDSHNLRSCSSDLKGHGEGMSPTRPPAASTTVGGGVTASASVATSHSQHPPSTIDEVTVLGCESSGDLRHQQNQQQQSAALAGSTSAVGSSAHTRSSGHSQVTGARPSQLQRQQQSSMAEDAEGNYSRQPARKSTTMFSISTTTAPRTSLLGITSSELPTPSSSNADPYAIAPARSYLRRPNSLLIVRSPPQDCYPDDILTTSNGVYYYSCPGVFSLANAAAPTAGSGSALVGPHGLQGSNSVSCGAAEGTSFGAPQTVHGRELAHAPHPYAPTPSGQGYLEASSATGGSGFGGHVRSHSSSPITVMVPSSSGGRSGTPGVSFSSHNAPASAKTSPPAGQQSPSPQALSMKTVLGQRRRSSLLRQQQHQQQQHNQQSSALFSFLPYPEAVGANLRLQQSAHRTTPPKLQRVESTTSSTADTVAFTPLDVTMNTKVSAFSPSPHCPLALQGPPAVDGDEQSPLHLSPASRNRDAASTTEAAQCSKLNQSYMSLPQHEDAQMMYENSGYSYAFTPLYPQRDASGLSTNNGGGSGGGVGGGSALRPTKRHSYTDVPPSAACGGLTEGPAPLATAGNDSFSVGDPLRTSSSLPATLNHGTALQSLSFATAMRTGDVEADPRGGGSSLLLHPLQQGYPHQHHHEHNHPEAPLGPWAFSRPLCYAPSENSAWAEQGRHGAVTPTAPLTPMLPQSNFYVGQYNHNMYSEPATPMIQQQQQQQWVSSGSSQQPCGYSATSAPHLLQSLSPAAQRTRSGLTRAGMASTATTTTGSPVLAPDIFCKLQRSNAQRLRRRLPWLPHGTACPGMAARLAYEAHRDAVRRGLVAEEEECSYYLSHQHHNHCPPPAVTPIASVSQRKNGNNEDRSSAATTTTTTTTTASSQQFARLLEGQQQQQRVRRGRSSPPAQATRPLCVVSLADLRASSLEHARRSPLQQQRGSPSPPRRNSAELDDDNDDHRSCCSSGGGNLAHPLSTEWATESWNGPRLLFQIPRCCDDPYHRDEEALEMMSVTTTSSCAFGAGLDGLSWREWMPSSPVEAGEEVLRSLEAACTTSTATGRCSTPSGFAHVPNSSHLSNTTRSGSVQGGQFAGGSSFVVPSSTAAAAAVAGGSPSPNAAGFAAVVPRTPLDIAAPRNADDMGGSDDAEDDGEELRRRLQRTETGGQSNGSATAGGHASSAAGASLMKRPFIAEWLVSKLQKHIEKKKLKKLQRQQAREAATVAAVYGGGGGGGAVSGSTAESFSLPFTTEVRLSRTTAGARRTRSIGESAVSDFSNASSPRSSSANIAHVPPTATTTTTAAAAASVSTNTLELTAQERLQQHQRLAYLTAAYQTELVICEQKRREALANRLGINALVEHSRARMTPEAAAAGYVYEMQGAGAGVGGGAHAYPPHPANTRAGAATESPEHAAVGAAPGSGSRGDASVSSDSYSSVYSQAVVSVASPIPTEEGRQPAAGATTTVAPACAARPPKPVEAVDNEPFARDETPAHQQLPHLQQQQEQRHKELKLLQEDDGTARRGRALRGRVVADTIEAERRRLALYTVHTKQKAIQKWMRAMSRK